ncbi:MAG: hypothetical protein K2X81_22880, partial [Candidatus Obscuribacterales bacterium]|nr:hypothetical protein [Candidatus Obscuribacterales bacterium]
MKNYRFTLVLLLYTAFCISSKTTDYTYKDYSNLKKGKYFTFTKMEARAFQATPSQDINKVSILRRIRSAVNISSLPCGILWSVSSVNGSETDFAQLSSFSDGESKYRLLSVISEAIISATRVRNALLLNSILPSICRQKFELGLFIDKGIVMNLPYEGSMLADLQCTFDKVMYF